MDEKKYDLAINLFSKKRQEYLQEIKEHNKEQFELWCLAWTMYDAKLERYLKRIKDGNGDFIFENGLWKIDEN